MGGKEHYNSNKTIKITCSECTFLKEEMAGVFCYKRLDSLEIKTRVRAHEPLDICPNIHLRRPKYIADSVKKKILELKNEYEIIGGRRWLTIE